MKLLNVPTSTVIHQIPLFVLNNTVTEGVQCMEIISNLLKVLYTEKQYEEMGNDPEMLEDEQIAEIDAAAFGLSFRSIQEYQSGMCAPNYMLARRVDGASSYLEQLTSAVVKLSALAIPLTDDQVRNLRKLAASCMAELSFFLYYGFLMDETESSIEQGRELEISIPVQTMLEETGSEINKFLAWINEIKLRFRPKLEVFAAFPELEEAFLEVAGPYISDFDTYARYVSIDIVRAVLVENADVEEIVKALETQYQEDEGN